uniref:Uncharacterized protein n=1 Tax=Onchocerca volvulus TaxID=6282 RepID=A0A8R1U022_ONCVO
MTLPGNVIKVLSLGADVLPEYKLQPTSLTLKARQSLQVIDTVGDADEAVNYPTEYLNSSI